MVDDHASAVAVGAVVGEVGEQALADALARHLDQTELGDVEHLGARLVARQGRLEGVDHLLAVVADLHVDEVDHDDPADVTQTELLGDFGRRLEVVAEHRLFEIGRADILARVHVDDGECLGVLDDERAAAR